MARHVIRVFAIFSLLASAASMAGCYYRQGRLEKAVVAEINNKCPAVSKPCQIDLNFIDWVDWDAMTVFAPGMDNLEINRVLGENAVGDSRYPLSLVMVLRHNGRVVYVEEDERNIEGYDGGEVEFYEDIDRSLYRFVSYPHGAQMTVERLLGRNGPYYSLKCVNCPHD
ncbi:MAG: hypothetical protein LC113_07155 [Acidobacteria bacterium]|nr:hypothetical protein [Acidobacteriota bacterium]